MLTSDFDEDDQTKSYRSHASDLSVLNDDECKRILAVVQRDFKLRQKENQRLLILINPKEVCSECNLFVCHDCSTYDKTKKVWICNSCEKVKELDTQSLEWFYNQTHQKYKRCGSAKVVRELHKREKELCDLIEKPEILPDDDNIPRTFLTVLQELHQDGRLASWKVRGQGDILSVKLTWASTTDHKDVSSTSSITNAYRIKATAQQRADIEDNGYGTLSNNPSISTENFNFDLSSANPTLAYLSQDKNARKELKEFSERIRILIDRLQNDLGERNVDTPSHPHKKKSKEALKEHQQQIAAEIGRARVLLSGTLRLNTSSHQNMFVRIAFIVVIYIILLQLLYSLQSIFISVPFIAVYTTVYVLFIKRRKLLSDRMRFLSDNSQQNETTMFLFNTQINNNNHLITGANIKNDTYEQDLQDLIIKQTEQVLQTDLSQFQKNLTTSKSSASHFDQKLAQAVFDKCVSKEIFQELPSVLDSSVPPKPQRQAGQPPQPTWSERSPRESDWEIKSRKDSIRKVSVAGSTSSENKNGSRYNTQNAPEIRFDSGLELDLAAINRTSVDSDLEAIADNESVSNTGDWEKNWQLTDKNHSGEETPRSRTGSDIVLLTIPEAREEVSPRVGDRALEDLADDDLYADDQSNIPTMSPTQTQDISTTDDSRKTFPLPANLILSSKRSSSNSYRQPSYAYESDDTESVMSEVLSSPTLADMKSYIDEEKFRSDPQIQDPKFIQRPKDLIVRCGEAARFKCKIIGTEPIDVFWFRFGVDDDLLNDEKYQITHDENYHYLKIYNTTKEDEGNYLCVLANDKAQNVDIIKLSVRDNKRAFRSPKMIQDFKDIDVNEGGAFTLKCKIDQGYPKARVLWYKENTLIRPDGHYKLCMINNYYGDGVHTLHVDESTADEDNTTFTCLVSNAAGKVHITADVFVHEPEVIDPPREALVKPLPLTATKQNETESMSNNDDKRQTNWSVSMLTTSPKIKSSSPSSQFNHSLQLSPEHSSRSSTPPLDESKRYKSAFNLDRSTKLLENWKNLYEASVNSLQSDDPLPVHSKPKLLDVLDDEHSRYEYPRSPTLNPISNPHQKSKWEVRLPELLNVTVGPDRPKRNPLRRHTTEIVYKQPQDEYIRKQVISDEQKIQQQNQSQSLSQSFPPDNDQPSSPLVKQLKQKFDKMGPSKVLRIASLTCRGLAANERPYKRPQLPVRPTPDVTPPLTSRQSPLEKGNKKTSPPNSYHNRYPPQSTKSVVKQLLKQDGYGAATVVYDSTNPKTNVLNANTDHRSTPMTSNLSITNKMTSSTNTRQNNEISGGSQLLQQTLKLKPKEDSSSETETITNSDDQTLLAHYTQHSKPSSTTIKSKSTITNNSNERQTNNNLTDSLTSSSSMSDIRQNLINPPTKPKRLYASSNELTTTNDKLTKISSNSTTSTDNETIRSSSIKDIRSSVLARAKLWDRRISVENGEEQDVITNDWSKEFEKTQEDDTQFRI
ncbi:unnamed protein product [Didymodactylos carnosus]|uniref:Uncharacterized protein n=1 Tax=Didymodactylos carnosus TaxID=1234261 RepID=A0A8S2D314_9BILA|nr:unnamed protein product [Didymodactylos carnosus]CAF3650177.1 unnamed protein product [Didymodactylos carnosus]